MYQPYRVYVEKKNCEARVKEMHGWCGGMQVRAMEYKAVSA